MRLSLPSPSSLMLRRVFALALIAHVTAADPSAPPSAPYPSSSPSTVHPPSTTALYDGTRSAEELTQLERPHKPVVTTTDDVTRHRRKRDNNDTNKTSKRRVVTGATVLSISGTLRDSISAPLSPSAASASVSRVSALVIRPAAAATVSAPPHTRDKVTVNKSDLRELVVSPHSVASLVCDLENATRIEWYKDGELVTVAPSSSSSGSVWRSESAGGVKVRAGRGEAGSWRCAGRSPSGGTLAGRPVRLALYESVRGVYLTVDNRRLDANTWMPLRESTPLSLACVAEGGVPAPELSWRLINGDVTLDHRHYLHVESNNHSAGDGVTRSVATVTATRELHNASLLCRATQHVTSDIPQSTQEAKLELHVTYPPSFVISRRPGFGVPLRAGGGAVLRCDVDSNPPSQPWWTRDQENTATSSPPPSGRAGWSEMRWSRLSPAHGGWYRCRAVWTGADYSSIGYYLNVQGTDEEGEVSQESVDEAGAEEEEEREDTERGEESSQHHVNVPLGGSVQLHCPKGSVGCWWRRSVGRGWSPAGSHHAHGVLGIRDAIYQEGGEYRCVGVDGAGAIRELKRVTLSVTGGPQASALSSSPSTGGWRLVCGACGRGVSARWLLPRGHWTQTPLTPDADTDTDNSVNDETPRCWRTQLLLKTPHAQDVLCVVTGTDGGAVAVFPARAPPSPAHPRHLTASHSTAVAASATLLPLLLLL